jgi:hypothetical protein
MECAVPTPFELEIGSLMRDLKDPIAVAEDLVRRWNMGILSIDEQRDCSQFFNAAGLHKTFFQQMRMMTSDNAQIPWAQFADALGLSRVKPSDAEIDAIFEGAKSQSSLSDLVLSHQLDIWSRKFPETRAKIENLRTEELEAKKRKLKDELEFLRANRLVNEEKRVLEEVEALFPADRDVKAERESFDVRWAREVLAKAALDLETPKAEDLARRAERLTPDLEEAKSEIVARALEIAKDKPAQASEIALALHFMDFHAEALAVLQHAPVSPTVDWQRLDFMLAARFFVDALEESQRLESVYANDPEAIFAASYARARALKGLGQNELAIDVMRALVRTRPGYKSAQSFLLDWSGGDE